MWESKYMNSELKRDFSGKKIKQGNIVNNLSRTFLVIDFWSWGVGCCVEAQAESSQGLRGQLACVSAWDRPARRRYSLL